MAPTDSGTGAAAALRRSTRAAWAAPATPCWRSRACCRPRATCRPPTRCASAWSTRRASSSASAAWCCCAPRARSALRILASSPAARIPPRDRSAIDEFPVLRDPAENDAVAFASGDAALALDTALGSMDPARSLLALPMQIEARRGHILVLADAEGRTFADEEVQVAQAFAAATSATPGPAAHGRRARRADRPAGRAGPRGQDAEREPGPEPRAGAHQPRGGQHPGRRQRHGLPRRRRGGDGRGGHLRPAARGRSATACPPGTGWPARWPSRTARC